MLLGMAGVKESPARVSVNRRARLRAQTRDEIIAAARELVSGGDELSMRGVARAVGMTAPALYRYVEDHDDLVDLLGGSLYDELIAEMVTARDAVDAADLSGRLVAMAHAFRGWALTHRLEYGLLFANPLTTAVHEREGSCTHAGGERFGGLFAEVFAEMSARGLLREPDLSRIDPELLRQLDAGSAAEGGPTVSADDGLPLPVRYLFVRAWTRLYGMVTLEAFGHLSWALEDSTALFEATLADNAVELGFAEPDQARRSTD